MTSNNGPTHVVVDGSNIATEGRSAPSLAQLNDAVMSFMEEHPDTAITVVVDATFGHRIDKKEAAEFEAGISNNELVAPPAGAIGRGDAFVLSIAQKAKASILSNDSFQEFHADYGWLFDEGRLIGGKPVPHVGWVFVNRSPVRGPVSRKVTQGARGRGGSRRSGDAADRTGKAMSSGSPLANEPMPVPKTPPPGRGRARAVEQANAGEVRAEAQVAAAKSPPRAGEVVNELMPFLEFVEHHPIGTSVNGIVESYSSHGAYLSIGSDGVRGYIPLRLMSEPPPTSARKVMQIGEAVTVVVVSFAAPRRSIDCALPDMAGRASAVVDELASIEPVPTRAGARATIAKKAPVKKAPAKKAPAKKAPAKRAPAKRAPAAKAPAAKASARTARAAKVAASDVPATMAPTGRAGAKNAAAKKTTATQTPAKKTTAKQTPAKKTPAKKTPAKKTAAKKTAAKQSPDTTTNGARAKKTPAKKTPARPAAKRTAEKSVAVAIPTGAVG